MAKYLNVYDLYKIWSEEYDSYPNPLIELEQDVVPGMVGDVAGKQLLDIGCGTGRYADFFVRKGADVIAIDFSWPMLKKAREKNPDLRLVQGEIFRLPFVRAFDVVLCNLVLSHIRDLDAGVKQISDLVRPGGKVIISDLRTGFGMKKDKRFRIFKNYSTNAYKHTLKDYHRAFENNRLKQKKFKKLVFDFNCVRRHKRLFYLAGLTIGYVFKLEKG